MNASKPHQEPLGVLATGGLHVLAVAILATGSAACFASEASLQVVNWAWENGALADAVLGEVALHVGLCALVWAALVVSFRRLRKLGGQMREQAKAPVKLKSQVGTVVTETLIVLPVALLLILGIAQLALVNIAGTLSDLAVIQAARAVWVWEPEAREGRFSVDRALVTEKARVQAAAIMTPTASSDFGNFNTSQDPDYDETFKKSMGAVYGAQLDHGGNDVGSYASTQAELELSDGREADGPNLAFNLAFDSDGFSARSARKFFNAWSQTEVEMVETQEWVGAKMTYHHLCLMPMVASLFGEYAQINGKKGFYVTIERAFSLPKHDDVKPNRNLPRP